MLTDKLRELALIEAKKKRATAAPTGSSFGACAAALQQAQFPDVTHPAPWQPRGHWVVEQGRQSEEWLAAVFQQAHPGLWALRGQPFYFPVPVPDETTAARIADRLRFDGKADRIARPFWGNVQDDFVPPKVEKLGPKKFRVRGIRDAADRYAPSIVLDRANGLVYCAVFVDGVVDVPGVGLSVIELKTMSNYAFRRALLGDIEYRYRCQLMGAVVAGGFDGALWLVVRKETLHMAEIAFAKGRADTEIRFTAPTGVQSVWIVEDRLRGGHLRSAQTPDPAPDAPPEEFPGDAEWEIAEVWTPFDEATQAQVEARVLRVLLADGTSWDREYGPDFRCRKCAGAGRRPCKPCQGTGQQTRAPKGKAMSVPCPKCNVIGAASYSGQMGFQKCAACAGAGLLEEVALPAYPCGYCPVVAHCWEPASVTFGFTKTKRPEYRVTRANVTASGLRFTPPEAPVLVPDEDTDDNGSGPEEATT